MIFLLVVLSSILLSTLLLTFKKKIKFFIKNNRLDKKLNRLKKNIAEQSPLSSKVTIDEWLPAEHETNDLRKILTHERQINQLLLANPVLKELLYSLFEAKTSSEFLKKSLKNFSTIISNSQLIFYLKEAGKNQFKKKMIYSEYLSRYEKIIIPDKINASLNENRALLRGFSHLKTTKDYQVIYFSIFEDAPLAVLAIYFSSKKDFSYKQEILYKLLNIFKKIFLYLHKNEKNFRENNRLKSNQLETLTPFIKEKLSPYFKEANYFFLNVALTPHHEKINEKMLKEASRSLITVLGKMFSISPPWIYESKKPFHYSLLFNEKIKLEKVKNSLGHFFYDISSFSENEITLKTEVEAL